MRRGGTSGTLAPARLLCESHTKICALISGAIFSSRLNGPVFRAPSVAAARDRSSNAPGVASPTFRPSCLLDFVLVKKFLDLVNTQIRVSILHGRSSRHFQDSLVVAAWTRFGNADLQRKLLLMPGLDSVGSDAPGLALSRPAILLSLLVVVVFGPLLRGRNSWQWLCTWWLMILWLV